MDQETGSDKRLTPSFPNYQQDLPEIKFIFPSVFAYFIIVRIIKEVCEAEAGAALVSDSDGY